MGLKRRDRTGDEYGSFRVTGPDIDSPHLWGGIWGCCGRYQAVTIERCTAMSKQLPRRCIRCVKRDDTEVEKRSSGRSEGEKDLMRERLAARKLMDNHPEERQVLDGVTVPGWGFVPALSGPFGRFNGCRQDSHQKAIPTWAMDLPE